MCQPSVTPGGLPQTGTCRVAIQWLKSLKPIPWSVLFDYFTTRPGKLPETTHRLTRRQSVQVSWVGIVLNCVRGVTEINLETIEDQKTARCYIKLTFLSTEN